MWISRVFSNLKKKRSGNSSFTLTRLIMKLFRNHLQPTSQWNCDNIILGFVQWILITLHEIASADMWNIYRSCFIKSTRMNKNRSCLQIVMPISIVCLFRRIYPSREIKGSVFCTSKFDLASRHCPLKIGLKGITLCYRLLTAWLVDYGWIYFSVRSHKSVRFSLARVARIKSSFLGTYPLFEIMSPLMCT